MEISINLVPPQKKEEIYQAKRLRMVFRVQFYSILIGLLSFFLLWASNYVLNVNLNLVSKEGQSDLDQEKYRQIEKYDSEFQGINSQLGEISKVRRDQLYWSRMLQLFNRNIPDGIFLEEVSTKDYAVFISGKADNRDTLISFRDKLGSEGCFSSVDLPLSNLVSKDNVSFQMDLIVKPECLK